MAAIVQNRLLRSLPSYAFAEWLPSVGIRSELREVTRRYFEPNAVPGLKKVARWPDRNCVFVYLPWSNEAGFGQRVPKAGTNDSVIQVNCCAVGIDIDQLRSEIGVRS